MSKDANETVSQYANTAEIPLRERAELFVPKRRRLVLGVLAERTTSAELGELAAEIAVQETRSGSPPEEALAEVKIDLHHLHLPKLDEAGVIDYDPMSRMVKLNEVVAGSDEAGAAGSTRSRGRSGLTDEFRPYVGEYFDASSSESASLDDLARYAATQTADPTDWSVERIRVLLHHAVLPKLDDVGVVDYDPRTKMVRCSEHRD